jgi:hypothetical protein
MLFMFVSVFRAELPVTADVHVAAQRSRLGEADSVEERNCAVRRSEHRTALTRENDVVG